MDKTRALRALLGAGGVVAAAAGAHSAILGARSLPGQSTANPTLESELRYYAAFYAAYGVGALRLAAQPEPDPRAVRGLAATLLCAGLARAGGWRAAGRPHGLQRGLLAIELGLPIALAGLAGPRDQADDPARRLRLS